MESWGPNSHGPSLLELHGCTLHSQVPQLTPGALGVHTGSLLLGSCCQLGLGSQSPGEGQQPSGARCEGHGRGVVGQRLELLLLERRRDGPAIMGMGVPQKPMASPGLTPIRLFSSPTVTCLARSTAWSTCCWCWGGIESGVTGSRGYRVQQGPSQPLFLPFLKPPPFPPSIRKRKETRESLGEMLFRSQPLTVWDVIWLHPSQQKAGVEVVLAFVLSCPWNGGSPKGRL